MHVLYMYINYVCIYVYEYLYIQTNMQKYVYMSVHVLMCMYT